MWQVFRRNPLAAALAIALHLLLLGWILLGIDWRREPVSLRPQVDVVQARVVDGARIEAQAAKVREAEAKEKAERAAARKREQQRVKALQQKRAREKQQRAERERQAKERARAKRRAEQKKQHELETRRQAKLKKQQDEKKQREEAEHKRRLEEKRRAEAAAKKKRQAEEKKRQREQAAARRRAEEKQREAAARQAREAELKAQLLAERNARERSRYVVAIRQRIEDKWLRPPNIGKGLRCTLRVRLIPSGDVLAANVIESSGNPAFDRSVENAVYKAAPLPVPSGAAFEPFRDLRLVFAPGG